MQNTVLSRIISIPQSPETKKKEMKVSALAARLPRRIEAMSGLVEATLIFALCASFSSTLFNGESTSQRYAPVAMQSHLLTATVVGFCQSRFSELELSLAAPDIVPTLVMSNLLSRISVEGTEPKLADSLAIIGVCSIMTGLGCIAVGRFGLSSQANNRMPEAVFNGFVTVAGILIFSKGLKMSMPKKVFYAGPLDDESGWQFLLFGLAGAPHGIAMFLQKRYDFSPADVVLPLILITPLAIFVAVSAVAWGPLHWVTFARNNGWMLDSGPPSAFYEPTAAVYSGGVDWACVFTCAPVLMFASSMFLVGDIFFKTLGTIKLLDPKKSIDREMILQGSMNIFSGLLGGVPGYSQMKLAAINICVVGKTSTSRVPGMISSAILGALFLSGMPLIEYVPRFWLSGILYNVAIGFIMDGYVDPPMTPRQRAIVTFMCVLYFSKTWLDGFMQGPFLRQLPNAAGEDNV